MKDDIPLLVFGERQEAPITARIKATSVYAGPNFSVLFTGELLCMRFVIDSNTHSGNRQMFKWNNIQNIPEHEEAVDIANEEQPKPNFKRPGDVEDNFQTTPLPVFENNNIRSIACSDTEILAVHQSGDIVSLSLKDGFMSFECENEDISVIKLCGSVRIAVNTSGSVLTWSDANCSALGRESVQVDSDSSEEIPPAASLPTALNGVSDVKDVACGSSHVLALLKDGQVLSWGSNSHGQLGRDSETEEQSIPAKIEFDSEIVVKSIDAAGNHSIVMAGMFFIRVICHTFLILCVLRQRHCVHIWRIFQWTLGTWKRHWRPKETNKNARPQGHSSLGKFHAERCSDRLVLERLVLHLLKLLTA